jgi:LysM repeat protein
MGLFGKSFEEKVADAVNALNSLNLGVRNFRASADGKVVTLDGEVDTMDLKGRVMEEFNQLVKADNVVNRIKVTASPAAQPKPQPAPVTAPQAAPAPPPEEERWHEVQKGETLSGIAKQYYGKASLYPKIFDANRNILSNPDLIKPGQRLKIPK